MLQDALKVDSWLLTALFSITIPPMDDSEIHIEGPYFNTSADCEPVLRALPGWFGIESATLQYVKDIAGLPTFLARSGDQVVGFLSVKPLNPYSAELYVTGVRPEYHHQGIGRRLVNASEEMLKEGGVDYFMVKTLGPSHPDEGYARTRSFYFAMGFRPLEEFTQLWDERIPCLLMVKHLEHRKRRV